MGTTKPQPPVAGGVEARVKEDIQKGTAGGTQGRDLRAHLSLGLCRVPLVSCRAWCQFLHHGSEDPLVSEGDQTAAAAG